MGEEPRETHGPSGPPCMSSSQAGRTGQERSHLKGSEQGLEYRGRPVTHTHHTACTGAGLLTAQQVTLHQDSSPCPATSRQHCQEQCSVWSGGRNHSLSEKSILQEKRVLSLPSLLISFLDSLLFGSDYICHPQSFSLSSPALCRAPKSATAGRNSRDSEARTPFPS